MLLGVDFDNTLISYDALFHRAALEKALIPESVARSKTAVRDHLRRIGREDEWTRLQGEVYGDRILEADPFPGVADALRSIRARGIPMRIVSHKTKTPYLGAASDLRAAARSWLSHHGFCGGAAPCFGDGEVFFESTKDEKAARIVELGCTMYVDDLPEILAMLPESMTRVLFTPSGDAQAPGAIVMREWTEFPSLIAAHG